MHMVLNCTSPFSISIRMTLNSLQMLPTFTSDYSVPRPVVMFWFGWTISTWLMSTVAHHNWIQVNMQYAQFLFVITVILLTSCRLPKLLYGPRTFIDQTVAIWVLHGWWNCYTLAAFLQLFISVANYLVFVNLWIVFFVCCVCAYVRVFVYPLTTDRDMQKEFPLKPCPVCLFPLLGQTMTWGTPLAQRRCTNLGGSQRCLGGKGSEKQVSSYIM